MATLVMVLGVHVAQAELKPAVSPDSAAPESRARQALQNSACEPAANRSSEIGAGPLQDWSTPSPRVDAALVQQARSGDPQSAWRVALLLFRGECSPPNYGQILDFIQIAAQAGHACATGAVGLALARGWAAERDLPQARELLERSAQAGCKRAYYWSWLTDELAARPQIRARAMSLLTQGADAGDGHALNALAVVREIEGQRDEARKLYARAAGAGNATARTNLARLARYFSRSTEKPKIASLSQRAEAGDPQAQFQLARRFHQGDGVPADYVTALKWYQRAAGKAHPAAREMLALIQVRLGHGDSPGRAFASLALIDLKNDELNMQRGVTQPIEDVDPLVGS